MSDVTKTRRTARRRRWHAVRRGDADRQPRGHDAARGARAQGGAGHRRRGHARGAEPACATSRSRGRRSSASSRATRRRAPSTCWRGCAAATTWRVITRGGHAGRVRSGRAAGRGGGGGGRARRCRFRARRRCSRRWWRRGCRPTSSTSSAFPRATAGRGCRRSRGCAASRPRWSSTRRRVARRRRCTTSRRRSATSGARCLARELTKVHEELVRGTLDELAARYAEAAPRGEVTIVVEGAAATATRSRRSTSRPRSSAGWPAASRRRRSPRRWR